jgi:hypothetical protein
MTTTVTAPPISTAELERAGCAVIREVEAAIEAGASLPLHVRHAYMTLAGLEQANREHAEARRLANLAQTHHYTAEPGDTRALCGAHQDRVIYGWVGHDNEFIRRSRAVPGKVICPDCDRLAGP